MLMGYRDLRYTEDRRFYFSVTSDPSTVSRLDSYVTNLNMPWDKKTDKDQVLLAVGNLEAWIRTKKGTDKFYYERLYLKTFKSQAICLEFNEKLGLVAVGLDNGVISINLFERNNPHNTSEVFGDKVHSGRVMRILVDERHGLLYSVGEDKYLRVLDLKSKVVVGEVYVSSKKPTEMVIDRASRIAYIADRNGSIVVVNLESNPPRVTQVVKTSSEGTIRGLEADFENKRLYCTCYDDGYIHTFKLFDPKDPEGRIEKASSVKGAPGPRVIRWWAERGELFVGHQGGLISVFNPNLNTTGPIYSSKLHDGNVNTIQIIPGDHIMISGSGDKTIRVRFCKSVLGSST
jgi:WD40 repeat protein